MIKAIIFDLGGVLFTDGTKRFVEYLVKTYKINREKVEDAIHGKLGTLYREAKITREEFWQRFLELLNINEDIKKLEDEWINGYELIKGTRDLIQELAKKYKVFFLSDSIAERAKKLNTKYNFLQWFEDGVFSHQVRVRKPNPDIYKLLIKRVKINPREAIFIDDKSHHLSPASKLGIKTILFTSPADLRKKFIELGIL